MSDLERLSDYERFLHEHRDLALKEIMALPEMAGRNAETVSRRRRSVREKLGIPLEDTSRATRLGKIADLLARSGIDLDEIARVEKVRLNEWQGFYKDGENEPHLVDMEAASLILTPKWADGPAWPVVQPASLPPLERLGPRARQPDDLRVCVVLPDMQIGFFRDMSETLHPTHDEGAMSIALQVIRDARPDVVLLLGDNLDFPELSKYRKEPSFVRTTQASIDRATRYLAEIRANSPANTRIIWLEGNHDKRVSTYILDNAAAAFGLRMGDTPQSWPVMSVPVLCRLDELGVEYISGYPANEFWINERLLAIHGDRASRGSNAHAYLNEERVSILSAHVHRREWAEKTKRVFGGRRTNMAACPGCMCKTDGSVPSTKGGTDLDGVPVTRYEDWQQGLAIVTYEEGDGPFWYEPIPIHDGQAFWRGQLFESCHQEAAA